MDQAYVVTLETEPRHSDVQAVVTGLIAYNEAQVGPLGEQHLIYFLRAADQTVVGGLLGETYWGWLHIQILWISDSLRHQGHGTALLAAAEQEAIRRGCHHAYLDTLSFQAPTFYEKNGYTRFGALQDMPRGHTRYFLQKELPSPSPHSPPP